MLPYLENYPWLLNSWFFPPVCESAAQQSESCQTWVIFHCLLMNKSHFQVKSSCATLENNIPTAVAAARTEATRLRTSCPPPPWPRPMTRRRWGRRARPPWSRSRGRTTTARGIVAGADFHSSCCSFVSLLSKIEDWGTFTFQACLVNKRHLTRDS